MNPEIKNSLRFGADGKFRVLMMSDFHAGVHYNPKMLKGIEALIEETKPDTIVFGGDQVGGGELDEITLENLKEFLTILTAPAEKRGIPWFHLFGNHDQECGMSNAEQEKVYETFPHCISEAGPEDISGTGNFVIPVRSHDGKRIAYNLWALDSHRENSDYVKNYNIKPEDNNIVLPDCFGDGQRQASPMFNQVMWYYNTSAKMEKEEGRRIPAVMFMHVPIIEFVLLYRNPEQCRVTGTKREGVYGSELNSGLFMACLERGDVKGIFCGHDHLNDFAGKYCGITLAYDSCAGFNMSAHDDLRGGRLIELSEDGSFTTKHIKLMELLGEDAIRNPEFLEGGCRYFIRKIT